MIKPRSIDDSVEKLEEITDPNTVVAIGGIKFTPAKLMIAGTILTTALGGLYGVFEVYKRFIDMQDAIETYVAPDLSNIEKRLEVIQIESQKNNEHVNEIRNDLKNDIRRLERVLENVERSSKQSQRETDLTVNDLRREMRELQRDTTSALNQNQRETSAALNQLQKNVDDRIKKALDNPLNN